MTIDSERWQAVESTRAFLSSLAGADHPFFPGMRSLGIPRQVRSWGNMLWKHYPEAWWMERLRSIFEAREPNHSIRCPHCESLERQCISILKANGIDPSTLGLRGDNEVPK